MSAKHSREYLNPLKKKFISPNGNRKSARFANISPKFKTNLKEFHKFSQHKKEASLKKKIYEMKKKQGERYHLGGNSSDPLNLNSLINRDPMLSTPQASPHPTHGDSPIEICYPHDDNDPLNLKCYPDEDLKEGLTPKKKKKKKHKGGHNDIENKGEKNQNKESEKIEQAKEKKKKKKHKKAKSDAGVAHEQSEDTSEKAAAFSEAKLPEVCTTKIQKDRKSESDESSDSEPPRKKMRSSSSEISQEEKSSKTQPMEGIKLENKEDTNKQESRTPKHVSKPHSNHKQKKPDKRTNKVFIYGNYNRYYNYRNAHCTEDLRLKSFNKDWFRGKDVLDIGCNVGEITTAIAQQFEPRIIIGNDIDNTLIKIAKSKCQAFALHSSSVSSGAGKHFPMSFAVTNGPIAAPLLLQNDESVKFPKNIVFKQENYVPPDEKSLVNQRPMFDTILCLSVTKWVHLNWGDQGLKLMFKKIFKNLRPGGRLILEPQPFVSYKKRRKLSEKIKANYDNIRFKPEQFVDYLLSDEVGFVAYEVLEEPQHGAPGFRRPIYLFTKAITKMS